MNVLALSVATLWKREIVKFLRDRSRVVGALAQPIGFWVMLGLGFKHSFTVPGAADVSYTEYLFPGIAAMIVLFTAIFSTISVVEERKSGFVQAALVAPVPRLALVLGNALGGTTLATVEALLFLALAPLVGLHLTISGALSFALLSILLGLAFTTLGYTIAWRMESTRGFHAVMNLFLLPLWFLSGAPFPLTGASGILGVVMRVNPVYYAVSGMRDALYLPGPSPVPGSSMTVSLLVTLAFALLMLVISAATVRRPLYATK